MAEQPVGEPDDSVEVAPGGPPNPEAGVAPDGLVPADDGGDGEPDDSGDGGPSEIGSAEEYAIPEIEGFDAEAAAASPVFAAMRTAAFKAGLDQAGFDEAIKSYVDESSARTTEAQTAEMGKLGANAKARIAAVGTFITSRLPAAQAEALRVSITTADAVKAIETLMGSTARRTTAPVVAPPRKERSDIERLMASPAYSGRERERDPKVIAEVEAWFTAEAKAAARK